MANGKVTPGRTVTGVVGVVMALVAAVSLTATIAQRGIGEKLEGNSQELTNEISRSREVDATQAAEIKALADDVGELRDDVKEIKGDVKLILQRLP